MEVMEVVVVQKGIPMVTVTESSNLASVTSAVGSSNVALKGRDESGLLAIGPRWLMVGSAWGLLAVVTDSWGCGTKEEKALTH